MICGKAAVGGNYNSTHDIVFVNGKCILEETGIHHRNAIYPLISIISKWKGYRENLADEEDFLVIKYQQLKGVR